MDLWSVVHVATAKHTRKKCCKPSFPTPTACPFPIAIRETMNLQAGQQFTVMPRGNVIELIPMRSLEDARGLLSDCQYEDSSEYRDSAFQ